MSKQVKDLLTLGAAALLVLTLSLWGIFKSDDAVSESERRPLKQFPLFSAQEVLSGRFQSNFESYTLDQFPLRDRFRTLKALAVRGLFPEKDNRGIYVEDGYAPKLHPALPSSTTRSVKIPSTMRPTASATYTKRTSRTRGQTSISPLFPTRIAFSPPKTAIRRWITTDSLP